MDHGNRIMSGENANRDGAEQGKTAPVTGGWPGDRNRSLDALAADAEADGSITQLIPALRGGDSLADQKVWERYFEQLVREVRRRLAPAHRRAADEEDVALGAFQTLFAGLEAGRFPQLADREDLWKLLVTLARRRALKHVERELAQKRGGGSVRGESAFGPGDASASGAGIGGVADDAGGLRTPEPSAEEVAALIDLQEHLFAQLPDGLREIARLKLEGFSNVEIGRRIGKSEALVRMRLQRIQKLWKDYRV